MRQAATVGFILGLLLITGQLMHDREPIRLKPEGCPKRPEISAVSPRVVIVNDECTGFIIGDGYVATAHHCIEPREKPEIGSKEYVKLGDGLVEEFTVIGLGDENAKDFAVLLGNTHAIPPCPISLIEPKKDMVLRVLGFGGGEHSLNSLHLTMGAYIGTTEDGYMETAVIVLPGDSGGPLLDEDGSVVGINVRTGYPIPVGLSVKAFYAVQAMVAHQQKGKGK
jgi:serine protease Do